MDIQWRINEYQLSLLIDIFNFFTRLKPIDGSAVMSSQKSRSIAGILALYFTQFELKDPVKVEWLAQYYEVIKREIN